MPRERIEEMRLSELRPCDHCHGKVAPVFYVLDVAMGLLDGRAARMTLGMAQGFGGALGLAEALSPGGEVKVARSMAVRLLLCQECTMLLLAQAMERERTVREERERRELSRIPPAQAVFRTEVMGEFPPARPPVEGGGG